MTARYAILCLALASATASATPGALRSSLQRAECVHEVQSDAYYRINLTVTSEEGAAGSYRLRFVSVKQGKPYDDVTFAALAERRDDHVGWLQFSTQKAGVDVKFIIKLGERGLAELSGQEVYPADFFELTHPQLKTDVQRGFFCRLIWDR